MQATKAHQMTQMNVSQNGSSLLAVLMINSLMLLLLVSLYQEVLMNYKLLNQYQLKVVVQHQLRTFIKEQLPLLDLSPCEGLIKSSNSANNDGECTHFKHPGFVISEVKELSHDTLSLNPKRERLRKLVLVNKEARGGSNHWEFIVSQEYSFNENNSRKEDKNAFKIISFRKRY